MSNNEIVAVLRQALEALEKSEHLVLKAYTDNKKPKDLYNNLHSHRDAITSLRQAIARAEGTLEAEKQEPDVIMHPHHGTWDVINNPPKGVDDVALYYAQPKRRPSDYEWVGLTLDERLELAQDVDWAAGAYCGYAEAIEAKLKAKNFATTKGLEEKNQ